MILDRHTIALISVVGNCIDVLGALYLAYDLLGGEHGPLRTLTRGVTYGVLFGCGYGIALGPLFGVYTGLTHGITLGWEFYWASRQRPKPGLWHDILMSGIRGVGFGLGSAHLHGWTFGAVFAILSTLGQVIAYQFGIRPTLDYHPATRPRITRHQLLAVVNRAVGYSATGYVSSLIAGQREHAVSAGLTVGLSIGVVTALFGTCTPFVEWTADHVPERVMGVFGICLIIVGFALQSAQYWVVLLDVTVR